MPAGGNKFAHLRRFDWDDANVRHMAERPEVSAAECEQVFFNRPLVVSDDESHSQDEPRSYALGQTDRGRCLFVAFTQRDELLRVVTARDMSRKERRVYGNASKETDS